MVRWNVEVTLRFAQGRLFEESRRHLGLETQRQCSEKAIARSIPALLGLFSLVCVMGEGLSKQMPLKPQSTAWYWKEEVSFSDVLGLVRRPIWSEKYLYNSRVGDDGVLFSRDEWQVLLDQLAAAA